LRRRAGHDRPLTLGQLVPGHEIDRDVIGQHANLADWQQKLNEINAAYPRSMLPIQKSPLQLHCCPEFTELIGLLRTWRCAAPQPTPNIIKGKYSWFSRRFAIGRR
jgi:hypothetical protein